MKFLLTLLLLFMVACSDNPSNSQDTNTGTNNTGNNDQPNDDDDNPTNDPNRVPPGSAQTLVRITHVYPFPYGREDYNETLDFRNFGPEAVSLVGWTVRDNDSAVWDISSVGTLDRGEKAFYKCLTPAQMDNHGDTLYLIDNRGTTIQTLAYGAVKQGRYVQP